MIAFIPSIKINKSTSSLIHISALNLHESTIFFNALSILVNCKYTNRIDSIIESEKINSE